VPDLMRARTAFFTGRRCPRTYGTTLLTTLLSTAVFSTRAFVSVVAWTGSCPGGSLASSAAFASPLGLGSGMMLQCAGRAFGRTVSGTRAVSAMAAGPGRSRKKKPQPKAAFKAAQAAGAAAAVEGGEEEMSNRAKFRALPVDPAVMKRIYDARLTAPMGAAMRNAARSNADELATEKQYKGFSRGPLYRDIPEPVMEMIGSTRKDKLTFIAGSLTLESMPPPLLPEVSTQNCVWNVL